MTKKLILIALGLATVLQPWNYFVQAVDKSLPAPKWSATQAERTWVYGDYRVERLSFAPDSIGPLSFGDAVVVAEPTDSCSPQYCGIYNVTIFKNGLKHVIPEVPKNAINVNRYFINGERFVYATRKNESNRFSVVEYDLNTGEGTILVKDVFVSGATDASKIDVFVDEIGTIVLNAETNYDNRNGFLQKVVYQYHADEEKVHPMVQHWTLHREEVLDVQGGVALVKMVFPSGHKQLWLMDGKIRNYIKGQMGEIPGTWTEPHGDIQGGRFMEDGSVRYIQYFREVSYDLETEETKETGNILNWDLSIQEALRYSKDGYSSVLDPEGKPWMDSIEHVAEAVHLSAASSDNDIYYENATVGNRIKIGFGSNPTLSDKNHVYWRGTDGNIYEATMDPTFARGSQSKTLMKLSGDSTIWAVEDGEKLRIPNEQVFYSWYFSFDQVKTVSPSKLDEYETGTDLSFMPGTLVKFPGSPKVYVMGQHNQYHWIQNEKIAEEIFGKNWHWKISHIYHWDLFSHTEGEVIDIADKYVLIK